MASKQNGNTPKKTAATTQPTASAQAAPVKSVAQTPQTSPTPQASSATPRTPSPQAPSTSARASAPQLASVPPRAASPQPSAAPAQRSVPQAGNLAVQCKARHDGSAEVVVVYQGALATKDAVLARAGTWRSGGQPWTDIQDVRLTRDAPGRYVGAISVPAGAPVEAVELAFHAGGDWDNGGRAPLGYYEWSVREQRLVVR